jgi:hypothetical protein
MPSPFFVSQTRSQAHPPAAYCQARRMRRIRIAVVGFAAAGKTQEFRLT